MALTEADINNMRVGGRKWVAVMAAIRAAIKPGVNLQTLSTIADTEAKRQGGMPSFIGYRGFPAPICLSVNDEVVHCIPRDRVLQSGDIITVDFGLYYHGVHVDAAVTWPIGKIGPEARRLLDGTYAALLAGTEQVKPGHHVGDISAAIGRTLTARGLTIFRQFVGHGIGRQLHEEPMVPNFPSGRGRKLVPGMALALEPIAGLGSENTILDDNNWDTRTTDGKPAAEFEHTVLVTETGVEVLTPLETLIGSQ